MTGWTRTRARWALAILLLPPPAGCDRSTAPGGGAPRLSLVFLDNAARLNAVRGGDAPVLTGLAGVRPVAATRGKVAFFAPAQVVMVDGQHVEDPGGLRLYSLEDGHVDTLPVPSAGGAVRAAISPDGSTMAYVSVGRDVHLVTVRLADNARDSVNLSVRSDNPSAVQAAGATPVYSPSGDSVAFLLPNLIGLQLLIYEVPSRRVEVFPVPVPVTTQYDATLRGWPRWTPDAAIRFLVRRRTPQTATDTLAVLKVFPRQPRRPAEVAFEGHPPAGHALGVASSYSFDAAGTTVAFGLVGADGLGIFVLRQGGREFVQMAVGDGVEPTLPLIVP